MAEELKQKAGQGDATNESGEGTPEEVKQILGDDIKGEKQVEGNGVEGEEEDCGFCLFMKGGGCKENFIAWEKCMQEAESNKEDLVEKCYEVTGLLVKCMEAHGDYYEPILRAEKALKEDAARQLEQDHETMSDAAATTTATE